ncbi:MAG: hypothetical protein D6795_13350, partial [Deltaproteobacteria bacterium]
MVKTHEPKRGTMKQQDTRRPDRIRFQGRILFLTEDLDDLRRQLQGEDLPFDPDRKLMDNISTDEIT